MSHLELKGQDNFAFLSHWMLGLVIKTFFLKNALGGINSSEGC